MREPESTRRRILHGAGIGGAGLIAGCFGSDGDDGGDTDDTGGADESADTDERSGDGEVHFLTDYYNDAWETLWGDLESEFEDETDVQLNIEEGGMSGTHEGRLAQLIQAERRRTRTRPRSTRWPTCGGRAGSRPLPTSSPPSKRSTGS